LIVQLVGEDENANTGYEVVASNLRVELGHRVHVAATVSCAEHTVTFFLQDLDQPGTSVQKVVVPHVIRAKLGFGASSVVVGGLNKRSPAHQWDGQIEALRIAAGGLSDAELNGDAGKWAAGLIQWKAGQGPGLFWAWSGDGKMTETADAYRQALNDLCQVLLNSNEFLYLH